jgi:hypothetical protein
VSLTRRHDLSLLERTNNALPTAAARHEIREGFAGVSSGVGITVSMPLHLFQNSSRTPVVSRVTLRYNMNIRLLMSLLRRGPFERLETLAR